MVYSTLLITHSCAMPLDLFSPFIARIFIVLDPLIGCQNDFDLSKLA